MSICHPEPKGAWFPLGETEILARGLVDYVDTGSSVDDAIMKVVSLDDDFYGGVLGIHEGWSCPWLGHVDMECRRFGIKG